MAGLAAIYLRGKDLELNRNVGERLRFHAIPVAISVVYHKWPHDYTAIKAIAMRFQGAPDEPIQPLIDWGVEYRPALDADTYFWAADDRGMADYVIAAFRVFGPRVGGLYSFYFAILVVSCAACFVEAGPSHSTNALLIFAVAAIYCTVAAIPFANMTSTAYAPVAIFEPRAIELLAFIPTLHLASAALSLRRWTAMRAVLAAVQVMLLVFCYHARSSVAWELALAFVVSLGAAGWWWRSDRSTEIVRPKTTASAHLIPAAMLALALGVLSGYKHATYNSRYFVDMGTRTIWHNALMGIRTDRSGIDMRVIAISDQDAIDAVISYLKTTGDPRLTNTWTTRHILDSLGGHVAFNWFVYEQAARDLYLHLWRTDPVGMATFYAVDKPVGILRIVRRVSRRAEGASHGHADLRFDPLSPGTIILALPGWLLLAFHKAAIGRAVLVTAGLLIFSCVPAVVFYPVVLTMMGFLTSLSIALFVGIGAATSMVAAYTRRRAAGSLSVDGAA